MHGPERDTTREHGPAPGRGSRIVTWALLATVLLAMAVWLYRRPHAVVSDMRAAAREGDMEALAAHIDLPALRADVAKSLREENRPGAAKSLEDVVIRHIVGGLADDAADALVSPELVALVLTGRPARPVPRVFRDAERSAETRAIMDRYRDPAAERAEAEAAREAERTLSLAMGYESLGRFSVRAKSPAWSNGTFVLVFGRRGLLAWKLEALRAEK